MIFCVFTMCAVYCTSNGEHVTATVLGKLYSLLYVGTVTVIFLLFSRAISDEWSKPSRRVA